MSVNLTPEIICKAVSWGTHSSIISVDPEGSIRPKNKEKNKWLYTVFKVSKVVVDHN